MQTKTKMNETKIRSSSIKPNDESVTVKLLKKNEEKKHSLDSCLVDIPVQKRRHSIASRHSIELFLNNFPRDETEFGNREILNAVQEMMRSSIGIDSKMSCGEKTRLIIESHKFHLFLIALVILDCICVVLQVILDIISKENHDPILYIIEEAVEIISVFLLFFFIVIVFLHIILLPKKFFKSKLEIFDSVIVLISFCLEIVSIIKKDSVREIEAAVITFRFWRIIRIVNAIVITVEKRVFSKLENLKKDIKSLLDDNNLMEADIDKKTCEIHNIRLELEKKTEELNDALSKLEIIQAENEQLRSNSETKNLKIELEKILAKNDELEKQIENLNKENDQLQNIQKESSIPNS